MKLYYFHFCGRREVPAVFHTRKPYLLYISIFGGRGDGLIVLSSENSCKIRNSCFGRREVPEVFHQSEIFVIYNISV